MEIMEFFFVGHQDPSLFKWGSPKEQETPLAAGDYVVVCLPDMLAELQRNLWGQECIEPKSFLFQNWWAQNISLVRIK